VKTRLVSRSLFAVVALTGVLTACGASAPPAKELADEIIDTLEEDGVPLSDEVKACMHKENDEFELTPEEAQGFENLDDVAQKANDGNEQAKQILARYEAALASCNP
jgi:hypothetical protein